MNTSAEFLVSTRYDGWENDAGRIEGKLRVPPETSFRPYPMMLDKARETAEAHGRPLMIVSFN